MSYGMSYGMSRNVPSLLSITNYVVGGSSSSTSSLKTISTCRTCSRSISSFVRHLVQKKEGIVAQNHVRKFSAVKINGRSYPIPYKDCTIGTVFETHKIPGIVFDCRKGTCKTCEVIVKTGEEALEEFKVLACQELVFEDMEIVTPNNEVKQMSQNSLDREKKRRKTKKVKKTLPELQKCRRTLETLVTKCELAQVMENHKELLKLLDKCDTIIDELLEEDFIALKSLHGNKANLLQDFLMTLSWSSNKEVVAWSKERKEEWS